MRCSRATCCSGSSSCYVTVTWSPPTCSTTPSLFLWTCVCVRQVCSTDSHMSLILTSCAASFVSVFIVLVNLRPGSVMLRALYLGLPRVRLLAISLSGNNLGQVDHMSLSSRYQSKSTDATLLTLSSMWLVGLLITRAKSVWHMNLAAVVFHCYRRSLFASVSISV